MSICDKVKQLVLEGWKLVDVREPYEFMNGHVSGAANVRMSDVPTLDLDSKYILYCRSGARSGSAQRYLESLGVTAVNAGGIHQFVGCISN